MSRPPDSVDVLIVGAGIYGATAAYEASRRGLSVLLLDRHDFGAGTSQNSLKIAHGGLRYLKSLDVRRARHSIEERRRLLQVAPHLVVPLRCRLDPSGWSRPKKWIFRAGLRWNEWLTRRCNEGVAPTAHLPTLSYPCWSDALIEDTERLLLGFIERAVALGRGRCEARNYAGVERLLRRSGRVVGAELSNGSEVFAGVVVDCSGVSRSDQPACLSMNFVASELELTAGGEAVALQHPHEGRQVFLVPWRGRTLIGTYDRDYPLAPDRPVRFDPSWALEFLDWLRPVHPTLASLERQDIHLLHFGVLPKDSAEDRHPGRRSSVREEEPGLVRVVGVKYTTARGVGSIAAQKAARILGRDPQPDRFDVPLPPHVPHSELVRDYIGSDERLASPIFPGEAPIRFGHVAHAVERERARSLSDVMCRRLGLASAGHPGSAVVDAVARAMAEIRGWTDAEMREEIRAFDEDPRFAPFGPPLSPRSATG